MSDVIENTKNFTSNITENGQEIFNILLEKNTKNLKEVLESNANCINTKDEMLCTPLDYAIANENLDAALLLVEKKADVNSVNKNGLTPLHTLIKNLDKFWQDNIPSEKILELLKKLIINGAQSNTQDRRGNTVINCLAQRAKVNKPYTTLYTKIGKMILSYDKNASETVQIQNNMGKTPLDYSSRNGNKILRDTIFDLLPQSREKINRIIEEGERAIEKALSMSKEEEVA